MSLPPYDKIHLSPQVMRALSRYPDAVKTCLVKAFAHIRDRKLDLDSPGTYDAPFVANACGFNIFVSVNPSQNRVAVVGLDLDP